MLDVDGQVISATELISRVEQLLVQIDARRKSDEGVSRPDPLRAEPREGLGQHLLAMRGLQAALQSPDVGPRVGLRPRLVRFVKRAVRRFTAWYVEPRWNVQQAYDASTTELAATLCRELDENFNQLDELRRRNATLRLQVVTSFERINGLRTTQQEFIGAAEDHIRAAASRQDVQALRTEVARLITRLGGASSTGPEIDYVAFEDRFRGDSGEVRASQERYLTLFPPPEISGRIVDIGCGRGEMLDLLREAGHDVLGVDPDSGMVEVCRAKGLAVVQADGISWLEQSQDDSLKGIFCAQVVEHLLTSELERLLRLGLLKLKRDGVLVVETINPRSVFALANHFFADTSHIRPVHPETLRFICEQVGFSSVVLEERSPHPMMNVADDLPSSNVGVAVEALVRSFFGYQDYVIVATK